MTNCLNQEMEDVVAEFVQPGLMEGGKCAVGFFMDGKQLFYIERQTEQECLELTSQFRELFYSAIVRYLNVTMY